MTFLCRDHRVIRSLRTTRELNCCRAQPTTLRHLRLRQQHSQRPCSRLAAEFSQSAPRAASMASAESEEAGPDRVDLYDQSSLRRALQEAAVEVRLHDARDIGAHRAAGYRVALSPAPTVHSVPPSPLAHVHAPSPSAGRRRQRTLATSRASSWTMFASALALSRALTPPCFVHFRPSPQYHGQPVLAAS